METRVLGTTKERFSLLGFGGMRLPVVDGDPRRIDVDLATEMVDYALARGVNYFDTAYMYHGEMSEPFLGQALGRHPRTSYKLATKLPPWEVRREEDIDRIFEEQLCRCRVDFFDTYLLHNVSAAKLPAIRRFRMVERLQEKKAQGLIGHLGFSFHDQAPCLETMLADYQWDFAQIQLNYLDWELQDAGRLYAMLTAANVPVVVMEPVRGGALATLSDRAVAILKEADPVASPASWALRFAASLPNVLTVLSGMSHPDHVRDNIRTMEHFVPLSAEERATLHRALAAYREAGAVPCTACRYCMDCPAGVDIPGVFGVYNHYCTTGNKNPFFLQLSVLGEDKLSKNCVRCGECLSKCPQQLDIPELMHQVTETVEELKKSGLPDWMKI